MIGDGAAAPSGVPGVGLAVAMTGLSCRTHYRWMHPHHQRTSEGAGGPASHTTRGRPQQQRTLGISPLLWPPLCWGVRVSPGHARRSPPRRVHCCEPPGVSSSPAVAWLCVVDGTASCRSLLGAYDTAATASQRTPPQSSTPTCHGATPTLDVAVEGAGRAGRFRFHEGPNARIGTAA